MAMSSKAVANTSLLLRIFVLLVLAASVVVMGTNTITQGGDKANFTDLTTYRLSGQLMNTISEFCVKVAIIGSVLLVFSSICSVWYVVAVGIVGFLYTLVQIPFSVYHVSTEKRWIRNGCLPIFDFYSDLVISFVLATAAGAGFAVTYELKKTIDGVIGFGETRKFLDRGYISTGLLFVGFICMAFLTILSSNSTKVTTSRGGFFG